MASLFRRMAFGFAFLLALAPAFAEQDGKVHVIPMDKDLSASELQGPDVVVHESPPPRDAKDGIPDPAARDQIFEKAGLAVETRPMDQLDRDLLFMRARNLSAAELEKRYPRIPARKLASLKKALEEAK